MSSKKEITVEKKLNYLLERHMKSEIAVWCNVEDTRTIGMWAARKSVPKKYHEIIKRKYEEVG